MWVDIMELLVGIVFLGGVFTLIGMKMRYSHFRKINASTQQEGEHLVDAVDNLRTEFGLLRNEVLELNERVEFSERLLERPKTEE